MTPVSEAVERVRKVADREGLNYICNTQGDIVWPRDLRAILADHARLTEQVRVAREERDSLEGVIIGMSRGVSPPGAPFDNLGDPDDEIDTLTEYVIRLQATRHALEEGGHDASWKAGFKAALVQVESVRAHYSWGPKATADDGARIATDTIKNMLRETFTRMEKNDE